LLQSDHDSDYYSEQSEQEAQLHLILSKEVVATSGNSRTLKFLGHIQVHSVLILVDSGSSHSFVNANLSSVLEGLTALPNLVRVKVASGNVITCSSELKQAKWCIQGHEFVTDLKVLHLPYYDMIVGIDWLESNSPMQIDWLNKWMSFSQDGTQVHLHGFQPALLAHSMVEAYAVSQLNVVPEHL
jgi:hypothetical protein